MEGGSPPFGRHCLRAVLPLLLWLAVPAAAIQAGSLRQPAAAGGGGPPPSPPSPPSPGAGQALVDTAASSLAWARAAEGAAWTWLSGTASGFTHSSASKSLNLGLWLFFGALLVSAVAMTLHGLRIRKASVESQEPGSWAASPGLLERLREAAASRRTSGDRFALGAARFLASLHIAVNHIRGRGRVDEVYFVTWGFTWVPWFFMLSGFVLFNAHLRRPRDEGHLDYALRRSASIYPLYAASLLVAMALKRFQNPAEVFDMQSYRAMVAQCFLLQGWWPGWPEHALQGQCWFLSCLFAYWLMFKPMANALQGLGLRVTLGAMLAAFAWSLLLIVLPVWHFGRWFWYNDRYWGRSEDSYDLAVVGYFYGPATYLHTFVLGMLLARLRLLLDDQVKTLSRPWLLTWLMELMAPLGYLGLLLCFTVPALRPPLAEVSARISLLLPLQAAVLLGLAGLPSAPVGFFALALSQLNFLENYSYPMYVIQFFVIELWPTKTGLLSGGELLLYIGLLAGFGALLGELVQPSLQKVWSSSPKVRTITPFAVAAALVLMTRA